MVQVCCISLCPASGAYVPVFFLSTASSSFNELCSCWWPGCRICRPPKIDFSIWKCLAANCKHTSSLLCMCYLWGCLSFSCPCALAHQMCWLAYVFLIKIMININSFSVYRHWTMQNFFCACACRTCVPAVVAAVAAAVVVAVVVVKSGAIWNAAALLEHW